MQLVCSVSWGVSCTRGSFISMKASPHATCLFCVLRGVSCTRGSFISMKASPHATCLFCVLRGVSCTRGSVLISIESRLELINHQPTCHAL